MLNAAVDDSNIICLRLCNGIAIVKMLKNALWRALRIIFRPKCTRSHDFAYAQYIGLVSAWQRAQDRERWRRTVETAMLQAGHAFDDDDHNATIINRKQVGLEVDLECRDFVLHSNVC